MLLTSTGWHISNSFVFIRTPLGQDALSSFPITSEAHYCCVNLHKGNSSLKRKKLHGTKGLNRCTGSTAGDTGNKVCQPLISL
jgi:hypothetical protein